MVFESRTTAKRRSNCSWPEWKWKHLRWHLHRTLLLWTLGYLCLGCIILHDSMMHPMLPLSGIGEVLAWVHIMLQLLADQSTTSQFAAHWCQFRSLRFDVTHEPGARALPSPTRYMPPSISWLWKSAIVGGCTSEYYRQSVISIAMLVCHTV